MGRHFTGTSLNLSLVFTEQHLCYVSASALKIVTVLCVTEKAWLSIAAFSAQALEESLYLIEINPYVDTCCFTKLPANVTASAMQKRWGIQAKQRARLPGKTHGVTVSKVLLFSAPGLKARRASSSA